MWHKKKPETNEMRKAMYGVRRQLDDLWSQADDLRTMAEAGELTDEEKVGCWTRASALTDAMEALDRAVMVTPEQATAAIEVTGSGRIVQGNHRYAAAMMAGFPPQAINWQVVRDPDQTGSRSPG